MTIDLPLIARRLAGASDGAPAPGLAPVELHRRGFLKLAALVGGGLTLSWTVPGAAHAADGAAPGAPVSPVAKPLPNPNAFVTLRPDNTVEIQVNRLDFGQGALTALPMLLAEELDVDWSQVRGELAPAGAAYKDPLFGIQMTGGSTGVSHSWLQYRQIGAALRMMLVAAAAEQWQVDPTRCTTGAGQVHSGDRHASYASLAAAAAAQPVPAQVVLKSPAEFRIIGKGQRRLDAADSVTGRKRYGIDMKLPNLKVALLLRAPTFGGQVESFDADKAKAFKGVLDVIQVPTDRGGTGLAVIADGYWPAKQARDALRVVWKTGVGGRVSSETQLAQYRREALEPKATSLPGDPVAIASFAVAPKKIVAEYWVPYLAHAPMETLNATFELRPDGATVWAGTQFQTVDQRAIAQVLGLTPEQVTLNTMPAGGGFGRRAVWTSDYLREGAEIAKAWGGKTPLKLIWSREDDIKGGYYRPSHLHRVEIGMDAQGVVTSWDHVIVGQSVMTGSPMASFLVRNGVDVTAVEGLVSNDYAMPMRLRVTHPEQAVAVLPWRSVGHAHTAFVVETLVDEIASSAGQDPVAWRLARFDPVKQARHAATLKLAVDKSGYGRATLPPGHAWGVAMHESFGSVVAYIARVSIVRDVPKVHAVTACVHANQVVNPLAAEAQIQGAIVSGIAMTQPGFEITLRDGVVEQSQFSDFPLPRLPDVPPVAVYFVESHDAPAGLGEPGVPPIAPAIANAVAALTGKRLRRLPFDLKLA